MSGNDSPAGERRAGVPQGLTVVIAGFLPILAIVSMFPAVPSIIDHFRGDPTAAWKVPWMVTAPGLAIAVIAPFAGMLVDRFGRRKLLVWSTFFYGLIGIAPLFLANLDALFASRVLLGVAEAAILTVLNTLTGDYWEQSGRRRWLSIQAAVGPFLASGLILASGFLTGMHWNGVFLVYSLAFPIFVAMFLFIFEPRADDTARQMLGIGEDAEGFPYATVALIGAVTLFTSLMFYVFIVNGGVAFREVGVQSPEELSKISFVPSLFVIGGAGIFWLVSRRTHELPFVVTLGLTGLGLLLMGNAPNWKWMAAALCIQQAGSGMTVPTLLVWAQHKLPFEHRGRGIGVWSACFFLGQFVSPVCVALVRNLVGSMQGAFATFGIIAIVAAFVALAVLVRRTSRPTVITA